MTASPRKPRWRRWFGSRSERAAVRFLKRLGHRVVARNRQCPLGELDLVTVDQDCVIFGWKKGHRGLSLPDTRLS